MLPHFAYYKLATKALS